MERTHDAGTIRGAVVLAFVALAATQLACDALGTLGGDYSVRERVQGDWIRVYFTNPHHAGTQAPHHGGLDQDLASLIRHAETSVDVAAYDLSLDSVTQSLIVAERRGVRVRLVTESDNAHSAALGRLRRAGIALFEDPLDSGRMHHKFVTVDDQWVWTGSWNPTESGTYHNNNHAVLIASPALAENYTTEFNEMVAGFFGSESPTNTPNPRVIITVEADEGRRRSIELESYFSPDDAVADQIMAEIQSAQERIRFLAFVFTSEAIADAMVERSRSGVAVQGIIEARNWDQSGSQADRLREAVHDILADGNRYSMHHKVIIIDDETVILGSYNFTNSAESYNDENLLIIHDVVVAGLFVEEFRRSYEEAQRQAALGRKAVPAGVASRRRKRLSLLDQNGGGPG
jgi:phosphatidylserine/phosphatidylglycerophosphate/cardiolipin synthase-like enzyme